MYTGNCLCGEVRFRIDQELEPIQVCHCSQCRKAHGSAFAAVSPIDSARFRLLSGAHLLKEFRSSPGKARVFCANCGSPMYSARDNAPEVKRLRLGTVETPFVCRNVFHIFVDSKASWFDFNDTHPRFAGPKA